MTRWRAAYRERYYTVTGFAEAAWELEEGTGYDDAKYESGNYFKTKAEAEAVAEKLRNFFKEQHDKEGGAQ